MFPSVAWPSAFARARPTALAEAAPLAGVLALAFLIRMRPALAEPFPVNDGGMFVVVTRTLQESAYALPSTFVYNGLELPFAYPPLGFYLAAVISNIARVPLTEVFRFLPPLLASLVVVAFVRLGRSLGFTRTPLLVATLALALVPASYVWLVMGGGLTRALGLLFALLALGSYAALFRTGSRGAAAAAAGFAALTVLSHSEMAWVLGFSSVLLLLAHSASRRTVATWLLTWVAAAALTAPWWLTVLARHGPAPLLAAAGTGSLDNPLVRLLIFEQTEEPWFPLFGALALVGGLAALGRREWLLPAWVVAIALLDSRSFGTLSAIPMALLAGIAVTEVIPALVRSAKLRRGLVAAALVYGAITTIEAAPHLLQPLSSDEREAMAWVRDNTPVDSRFLVVSELGWAHDRSGEWLFALADRPSVATVQGYEWLPGGAFWDQMRLFQGTQSCAAQDAACLDALVAKGARFDHVYLPNARLGPRPDNTPYICCGALRVSLRSDPRYVVVYDGPGATVFARRT